MIKVTARAHSNIALVKYWGKRHVALNLPATGSVSITLDALFTESTVFFDPQNEKDVLFLNGKPALEKDIKRLTQFVNRVRTKSTISDKIFVESKNNFPTSAGLASSASSFACLALAVSKAAGLSLSKTELSELARLGSGSAARSIFGGFVEMHPGKDDVSSKAVARQLFPESYWDLDVLIAITSEKKKKVGSTDGMELSRETSPYYPAWIDSSVKDIDEIKKAILNKDFQKVADISEFSCLKMHALALSSNPGLIYWNGTTVDLIHFTRELRSNNIPAFFTIDAGPQVKIICRSGDTSKIVSQLENQPGVKRVLHSKLGGDAKIIMEEEC